MGHAARPRHGGASEQVHGQTAPVAGRRRLHLRARPHQHGGQLQRVASAVQNLAQTGRVAEVRAAAEGEPEVHPRKPQLAHEPVGKRPHQVADLGVEGEHVVLVHRKPPPAGLLQQAGGVAGVGGEGLLQHDVLAGLKGPQRPGEVQGRGSGM